MFPGGLTHVLELTRLPILPHVILHGDVDDGGPFVYRLAFFNNT